MNPIRKAVQSKPVLAPFFVGGYPSRAKFRQALLAATDADLLEIGVPFSDPVADGPTIQAASEQALHSGIGLTEILSDLRKLRGRVPPVLLMSYLNPLLAHGLPALIKKAPASGVGGFIIPDLPEEEAAGIRAMMKAGGLELIPMVTPTTPTARMREVGRLDPAFVYLVSVTGVTGARKKMDSKLGPLIRTARKYCKAPVLVGFGIRDGHSAARCLPAADGVIVGSALVEKLGKVKAFLGDMRRKMDRKAGKR